MIELMFTLPEKYPQEEGIVCHVRLLDTRMTSPQLKQIQNQANKSLASMIKSSLENKRIEESDSCDVNVFSVIQWMEDFERNHLHNQWIKNVEEQSVGVVERRKGVSSTHLDKNDLTREERCAFGKYTA
jgi:ABC-type molybdate transport system substrate-binding protein